MRRLSPSDASGCRIDAFCNLRIDFPKLPRRLLETPPDLFNCLLTFLSASLIPRIRNVTIFLTLLPKFQGNRFSSLEVFINPLRVLSAHSHGLFKVRRGGGYEK